MREQDTIACEQVVELLNAYADGELNSEERAAVKAHLDGCPSCRVALEEIEAVAALVANANEQPSPALRARVMQAIAEEKRVIVSRVPMWRRWGTVAAAFACVVVVAMALWMGGLSGGLAFAPESGDFAMGGDAMADAPAESVPSHPSTEKDDAAGDWWADEEDAADDVTDNDIADVVPPSDVAPEEPEGDCDEGCDAPSSSGGAKPSLGTLYELRRVAGDGQIGGLSLKDLLDGEWVGDDLFLSFARETGEVKVELDVGDVRMGRFSLEGDVLTIALEGGEKLIFRVWVEEGCLCLMLL